MKKLLSYVLLALVVAWVVLLLASWLLSATSGGEGTRSLLSSEGIRYFLGGFVDMLQKPLLIWLLLLSAAYGCMRESGIAGVLHRPVGFRQRQAIVLLAVILLVYVGVVALLALPSHAVLLSATGHLWPSAFSRALVPIVAFGIIVLSVTYGLVSRHFQSVVDVCQALCNGIATAAPLLLLYVLAVQFYESLRFVVGIMDTGF